MIRLIDSAATLDATQELLTLGVCNILGSFISSMPTSGAITRSAVSQTSGIRTPFAGIYTATISLLALSILTPYFYFIPQATLASILIVASMFTVVEEIFFFCFFALIQLSPFRPDRLQPSVVFVAQCQERLLVLASVLSHMSGVWYREWSRRRCCTERIAIVVSVGSTRNGS